MSFASYPSPLPGGAGASELALTFDAGRTHRILVCPALFEEGHKLRHLTVEVMRRLDGAGIDSLLPDLPSQLQLKQARSTRALSSVEGDGGKLYLRDQEFISCYDVKN